MDPIRLSGLSSGFDWEAMVQKLIAVERRPIDMLRQRQAEIQRKKQAWLDVQSRLDNLSGRLGDLKLAATFLSKKAVSADDKKVTAGATTAALNGTYTVTVKQLATASRITSASDIGGALDAGVSLVRAGFGVTPTSGTFTINGVQFTIDASTQTLTDVMNAINASAAGVTASYDAVADQLVLKANATNTQMQLGAASDTANFLSVTQWQTTPQVLEADSKYTIRVNGLGKVLMGEKLQSAHLRTALSPSTGSFKINNVTIAYDAAADTLKDVIDRINRSGAGVTASYDPGTDKFTLVSNQTGNLDIAVQDVSGNFLAAVGIGSTNLVPGQNAVYAIAEVNGGADMTSTSNSVTTAVDGVTFNLVAVSDKDAANNWIPTRVTIAGDVQKAVDAVKAFVDQYNSVQDFIAQKLSYGKIEDKKDDGDLAGDPTLAGLQSALRRLVSGRVSNLTGSYSTLAEIGIQTTNDKTAKLTVDETKLRAALDAKPRDVQELFYTETNYALGTRGATVTASSELGGHPASTVINGITDSALWAGGEGWSDNTASTFPDTLTIDFGRIRNLEKIVIYTLEPAATNGIRDYTLTLDNGTTSKTVATVTGNTQGVITHLIPTTAARSITLSISGTNAADGYSKVLEIQAYEANGVAALLDQQVRAFAAGGTGIISDKDQSMQKSIDALTKQIGKMEERLAQREKTLYNQFIAMEQALSKLGTQRTWLNNQLGIMASQWSTR